MGVRKRIVRIWDVPAGGILPALVVVSAAFALGGVLGCGLAAQVGGGGGDMLHAYVTGYLTAARAGEAAPPHMLSVVWSTIRWPVFAVLMGFTGLGLLGIPVLFSIRGFLLSFAITSFVRMFGGVGGVLAFLTFGVTGLVAIPVLFVLGVQSLAAARLLAGRFFGRRQAEFALWPGVLGAVRPVQRRAVSVCAAGVCGSARAGPAGGPAVLNPGVEKVLAWTF